MTTETTGMGALFGALAKAQAAIRGAEKDRVNPHFKQGYATLASVWDACRTALTANGLAVIQAPSVDEHGHVSLRTVLGHTSGACIEATYPIRPVQDTPQAYGSALTYARRYSLASMVGVAPDDDDGNDASMGRGDAPVQHVPQHVPVVAQPVERRLPEQPRTPEGACPKCGSTEAVIKSKFKAGELVCFAKKNGCGHKWAPTNGAEPPPANPDNYDGPPDDGVPF